MKFAWGQHGGRHRCPSKSLLHIWSHQMQPNQTSFRPLVPRKCHNHSNPMSHDNKEDPTLKWTWRIFGYCDLPFFYRETNLKFKLGLRVTDERLQHEQQLAAFNGECGRTEKGPLPMSSFSESIFLMCWFVCSFHRVWRTKQSPGQVHGDDAVAGRALPFGSRQYAAAGLQDQEHWGVSRAGYFCRSGSQLATNRWWRSSLIQSFLYIPKFKITMKDFCHVCIVSILYGLQIKS